MPPFTSQKPQCYEAHRKWDGRLDHESVGVALYSGSGHIHKYPTPWELHGPGYMHVTENASERLRLHCAEPQRGTALRVDGELPRRHQTTSRNTGHVRSESTLYMHRMIRSKLSQDNEHHTVEETKQTKKWRQNSNHYNYDKPFWEISI